MQRFQEQKMPDESNNFKMGCEQRNYEVAIPYGNLISIFSRICCIVFVAVVVKLRRCLTAKTDHFVLEFKL